MKRIVSMLIGCVLAMQVCGLVYAADDKECKPCDKKDMQQGVEKMQQKHLDKMAKELNLTPDQKQKISAIMKENGEKRKTEMDKKREEAKAEMEATDKKITDILTPEQAQKFEKMKTDRKEKMEKKMKKMHHDEDKAQ